VTIDANIIIAYLAGETDVIDVLSSWQRERLPLFLSTVAETEVLSFSEWTDREREATEVFLNENFISISFDKDLCRIAAGIRRRVKIKFPDAAIAATSLFTKTPVVTRNTLDFKRVSGIQIVNI
jgi:predicted nucleic acid-binding protein